MVIEQPYIPASQQVSNVMAPILEDKTIEHLNGTQRPEDVAMSFGKIWWRVRYQLAFCAIGTAIPEKAKEVVG